ncbi:MAG TPA: gephyrin-like molybdotransferase Glp [Anaerolineaceae bacterium]|nr:gephyrin-like molybdotransferase Glp [Anaerolineaceae bacterium]
MVDFLSVQEARLRILASIQPADPISRRFDESLGFVIAEDIVSDVDLPPFRSSSMDGFAVIASDLVNASTEQPVRFQVVGDIPAGISPNFKIHAGKAARIMTGAPLPEGADTVVPLELVTVDSQITDRPYPAEVRIAQPVEPGQYVRPVGQDIRVNQTLIHKNTRIRAQEIGLLAMLGRVNIQVYPKPRVAIVATGDELLAPEQPLLPGKVRDSNTPMLSALVTKAGGEVVFIGLARDNYESIRQILDAAVEQDPDLLITSAGVSVGVYDYVRLVIETDGELHFWRVNIRPGKPFTLGNYRGKPLLGLPGNPVSSFVDYLVFVQPALDKWMGTPTEQRPTIRARMAEGFVSDGRETYLRATLDYNQHPALARLTGHQGSGNLLSLVQANALLIIPSGVKSLPAESEVDAWILD